MTTGQGSPGARAGHVRAGPMRPIGVLLREHGVDLAAVLRECGLPATALDDADAQLSYRDGGCLFQRAAWALQRPDFGLLVGERFELASLGLLGDLMRQAPTVGGALDSLVRFFHLQDRGSALYLRQPEAGLVAVGYSIHDVDVPGSGLAYDAVMAMLMRALRALCGPRFRVVELQLAHAAPADTAPYRRLFGVPAVFDAPHSELRFDRRWLDARVAGGRDNAMGVVRRAAQAVEAADPPHLDERVRVAVRVLLAAGDVSAPRLAEALGLHERTLRRRLAPAGANVQRIVADERFRVARQLLRETALTVQDVGRALGYADDTAFVRAFRAWSGQAPGQWRAAARGGMPG